MALTRDSIPGELTLRNLIALATAVGCLCLLFVGAFEGTEDVLTRQRAQILDRDPTGEVVIVEIDAKSLARINTWPWSRRLHAQLIDRLHSAGATLIAFDVDFSAASDSAGDQALARAIRTASPVILPVFEQRESDQSSDRRTLSNRPAAAFRDSWIGGVNIFPGRDGLVRDYPAATYIDDAIQPSLATLVAEDSSLGDRTFQPDWGIDVHRVPRLSFVDVIDGRVARSRIAGKRIIVGATAIELGDRYTVPRFGVIPGVSVQALAAESMLQGRTIMRSGVVPTVIGAVAIVLLLGTGMQRAPFVFGWRATAVFAGVAVVPTGVQARLPISIDSAAMLFAWLGCVAAWGGIEVKRRIRARSLVDADSGLPNRLMLLRDLDEGEGESPVILVTAAIDRFDVIRDAIGTAAVNELVRQCAVRMGEIGQTQLYRVAPDTLAWLVPDRGTALTQAHLEMVERAFRRPFDTQAGAIDVLLTFGLDRDRDESSALLRIERTLATVGKARNASMSYLWHGSGATIDPRELSMMGELRQGMTRGDVHLVYQPKINLGSGRIADAEALLRWQHPSDGAIPPDRFIPLAESTGVVRDLTHFALEGALAACVRWNAEGVEMRVAVNVSAADIATEEFVARLDGLLARHGVAASQLAIEVTESAIIRSPDVAISVLQALRERDVRLSIDDYGTGQSTLTYLKRLPVHELKIDKSFITSLCTSKSDLIMVRSTINLAHELGLAVVAEGVEDRATLDLLSNLGCDYGQGYFIGKPMAQDALSTLVTSCDRQLVRSA